MFERENKNNLCWMENFSCGMFSLVIAPKSRLSGDSFREMKSTHLPTFSEQNLKDDLRWGRGREVDLGYKPWVRNGDGGAVRWGCGSRLLRGCSWI